MIRVHTDHEALSRAAAELFAEQARLSVEARGRFCVALSGGETPRRTFELLATTPWREQVPWPHLEVFWGDERCVPVSDSASNQGMARRTFLDRLPIPTSRIHPMNGEAEPAAAAEAYERELDRVFAPEPPRFDLLLLGLGSDGHTASLFPGSASLEEQSRRVLPVQAAGQPFARLTLTLPVLNSARLVAFLVSGADKAEILRRVLRSTDHDLPAARVSPEEGEVLWLVDQSAVWEGSRRPGSILR